MFTTRLFNPLTGEDLKQIINNHVTEELGRWQILASHLTFPKGKYTVEISVDGYPMNQPEILTFSREFGETQESAPDKLREDNSIPTTRTERDTETGQMVDARQPIKATVGQGEIPRESKPFRIPKAKSIEKAPESSIPVEVDAEVA